MNRWLILSILLLPLTVTATVEKLEFVTPARVAAPGALSEKITVQTQNVSGESEKLSGTADLSLNSSSLTGEFSSSATNWESIDKLTMASGTANRSFYYRDSGAGSPTLTVTVTMRDGGPSWTANQIITIGQAVVEPLPPNPDPVSTPPPPVVESPFSASVISNQSFPPAVSPATSTMLSNSTSTTSTALATLTLVPVVAPASVVLPSVPAAPAYVAELARLNSELTLAAAKLQIAQKGGQRETKVTEPKTPKTAALEPASANAVAHDNLAAAAVIEISKPPSFFERLIVIPRRIWSAITNLFRRR